VSTAPRETQQQYWNRLYQTKEYIYGTQPNEYLRAQGFRLRPGSKALAAGDGEGRNGVWLAEQGLNVVAVDLSSSAIEKASRLAGLKDVHLNLECCDLAEWEWPKAEFDVIAAIYLHLPAFQRKLVHARLASCLKRDGILILEAFHRRQAPAAGLKGRAASLFYTAEILRHDFRHLEILELLDGVVTLNEGFMHQGTAEIVRLVAQKRLEL
jgi:2-polyprenyl-3-methyl-5-hydroxy-6-metoxy-1,4-benzoquinol methylase